VSSPVARKRRVDPGLLLLAAILLALPLILPNRFYYDLSVKLMINAIVCIGLNLLIGYAGQISLGHAAFFALGGYASALLAERLGFPSLLALVCSAALVGLLAYLVARPILRLKGNYLAMATLGFGIIVSILVNQELWLSGGPDGKPVQAFSLFSFSISKVEHWYFIVALALLAAVWLALNLINSAFGRALRALHSSETAAAAMAIDIAATKARVFVVSAIFAAVAGSLFAYAERFITPGEAGFIRSIELVTMVVLGGMASIYGAVVGAGVLTLLGQALANFSEYKHVILGAILVTVMVFMPLGLVPTLRHMFKGAVAK